MGVEIQTRFADLWSKRWNEGACRLRFELGDPHERLVPRALQAVNRAISVADTLFHDGCIAIVATYYPPTDPPRYWPSPLFEGEEGFADGFAVLQELGFEAEAQSSWQSALFEDDDPEDCTMFSFNLSGATTDRDTLLWNSVVLDMPIWPKSSDHSFLLHPDKPILLHVYDDRGMDVIADGVHNLESVYREFDRWLLDDDRPRVKQVFG